MTNITLQTASLHGRKIGCELCRPQASHLLYADPTRKEVESEFQHNLMKAHIGRPLPDLATPRGSARAIVQSGLIAALEQ